MVVSGFLQIALNGMFAAAGLFALGTIIATYRSVRPGITALRQDLAQLASPRACRSEVRFRLVTTEVCEVQPRLRVVSVRNAPVTLPAVRSTGLRAAA